jgi:hypothetical protein
LVGTDTFGVATLVMLLGFFTMLTYTSFGFRFCYVGNTFWDTCVRLEELTEEAEVGRFFWVAAVGCSLPMALYSSAT